MVVYTVQLNSVVYMFHWIYKHGCPIVTLLSIFNTFVCFCSDSLGWPLVHWFEAQKSERQRIRWPHWWVHASCHWQVCLNLNSEMKDHLLTIMLFKSLLWADIFGESIDPVHRSHLNDLFMNQILSGTWFHLIDSMIYNKLT